MTKITVFFIEESPLNDFDQASYAQQSTNANLDRMGTYGPEGNFYPYNNGQYSEPECSPTVEFPPQLQRPDSLAFTPMDGSYTGFQTYADHSPLSNLSHVKQEQNFLPNFPSNSNNFEFQENNHPQLNVSNIKIESVKRHDSLPLPSNFSHNLEDHGVSTVEIKSAPILQPFQNPPFFDPAALKKYGFNNASSGMAFTPSDLQYSHDLYSLNLPEAPMRQKSTKGRCLL